MLTIYGSPFSGPTNKVRYVANYLKIPATFVFVSLKKGEQRQTDFLAINPIGKIPAIDDNGFSLAESNAIIRYLANQYPSSLYPENIQARARVDQWIEYATQHVAMAMSKIMWNTYFYKNMGSEKDERSLADGRQFMTYYLPTVAQQLQKQKYLAGEEISLADLVLLAALDPCELCEIDLTPYPVVQQWRKTLMTQDFYKQCYDNFTTFFQERITPIS